MGLNMPDLAARPRLAKDLVAAHLVLAVPPNLHKLVAEGQFEVVPTTANWTDAVLKISPQAGRLLCAVVVDCRHIHYNCCHNNLFTTVANHVVNLAAAAVSGGVVITDGQGNKANVLKLIQLQPNQSAIVIDNVLMSGGIEA
jgi:hypothetical protein